MCLGIPSTAWLAPMPAPGNKPSARHRAPDQEGSRRSASIAAPSGGRGTDCHAETGQQGSRRSVSIAPPTRGRDAGPTAPGEAFRILLTQNSQAPAQNSQAPVRTHRGDCVLPTPSCSIDWNRPERVGVRPPFDHSCLLQVTGQQSITASIQSRMDRVRSRKLVATRA